MQKSIFSLMAAAGVALSLLAGPALAGGYPVVGTGQTACFDDVRQIRCPQPGQPFDGQDGQYKGNAPHYRDNGDGTVSDLVTGLMWVKARGSERTWQEAVAGAAACRVGGHYDWRAPTIKELYSLIDFNGWVRGRAQDSVPFLDTRYFEFVFGDTASGKRIIDCQDWSSTTYRGVTMCNCPTAFGVNFADGRIKGYPKSRPGPATRRNRPVHYVRYVRGNPDYGKNDFVENHDGTVLDRATGLIWQHADSGKALDWQHALAFCQDLSLAGHDDWRLPDVKELQSIVDYSRGPTSTGTPALDPIFSVTDPESYFWSSTTHLNGPEPSHAAYMAFGRAMGYFTPPGSNGSRRFLDVHGAGAQRSDPKSGNPSRWAGGHGPQGDDVRIFNYARCVRGGGVEYWEPPHEPVPARKGGGRNPNTAGRPSGGQGMGSGSMSGPMRHGPPPEAKAACSGVSAGDDCSFQSPHGTVRGLCRDLDGELTCIPAGGPGRPRQ